MTAVLPSVAVIGASGLIGQALAIGLRREGFPVVAIARRFTKAQRFEFADGFVETPVTELDAGGLAALLSERRVDIVVNCVGVLQDTKESRIGVVHRDFIARILEALAAYPEPTLLVHLSIPGRAEADRTPFSQTKREAEQLIAAGSVPFVVLRPGFVVAPAAYGGSALIRALAALPLDLPTREAQRPFAATDIADIAGTVAMVARRWRDGEREWSAVWDVMERNPASVGGVVNAFRRRFGGPSAIIRLPSWLMDVGVRAGDLSAYLGWASPIRSTALAEMQRGVDGDPEPWIAATGIEPASLDETLRRLPATVQEAWFARLYLAKALIIASLVVFWVASGLIALMAAFDAATSVLIAYGFQSGPAQAITVVSSLVDIAVGLMIAVRKTCRVGLLAGIAVSLGYMAGAAVIAPELWIEPLGALVKTGPAIVLMVVALAIRDAR